MLVPLHQYHVHPHPQSITLQCNPEHVGSTLLLDGVTSSLTSLVRLANHYNLSYRQCLD